MEILRATALSVLHEGHSNIERQVRTNRNPLVVNSVRHPRHVSFAEQLERRCGPELARFRRFGVRRFGKHAPDVPALEAAKHVIRSVGHELQQFCMWRPTHRARRGDHAFRQTPQCSNRM
jgi:hypothetical protein